MFIQPTIRALLAALLAGVCLPGKAVAADLASAGEYEIKAAMIYSITRFVEWPASKLADPSAPFAVCVLGPDPFGGDLDKALTGKMVAGRRVTVRRVSDEAAVEHCHMLFIAASERKRLKNILAPAAKGNALLVGDGERFAAGGAAVGFVIRDGSVQLEVNLSAAQRSGLIVSSKLLRIASLVKDGG